MASMATAVRPTQKLRLSASERRRLTALEDVVTKGDRVSYLEVGLALQEIRDGRLYRATHSTFEDYCQDTWDWGRSRADKQIRAATVVVELGAAASTLPNESIARELGKIKDQGQRAKVWTRLTRGRKSLPTYGATRAAVFKAIKSNRK
jgi:hypothetical protein